MSIKVEKVSVIYQKKTPFEQRALNNVSLTINQGDILGIYGLTGSGKSTLLQTLNGLIKPDSGNIIVDGVAVNKLKGSQITELRHKVGMIFQYPELQIFERNVFEEIAFGLKNIGLKGEQLKKRVTKALDLVDMSFDEFKDRSPFTLSSGQKKRITIASVLACKPKYLLFDEPTTGLDTTGRTKLLSHINEINNLEGITSVLVSHKIEELVTVCNKLIIMANGEIALKGTALEVIQQAEKNGLVEPITIRNIANNLKQRGFKLEKNILNIEDLSNEIIKALNERGNNSDFRY
ncbi:ATPase [Candidatus Syntrophocurvum alkaliphilum]|uniref:ATPase n=1 Tax=Candidatus Syntrophocurvum alkaliphilum TaxID=2293317 RepID=A0A6I6DJP5_9FIRM|nr:ATP-binding cassette domain-containing protein [Candidatus Syntrophocurvum alkaliphilum]QGU00809.1 ATPase [Candidatus Syntrophocurvum alkaliphilum]